MSYQATSLHQTHPVILRRKRDLCIRHCKSDPMLASVSRTSFLRCQEGDSEALGSIENLALQTDAVLTIEGLKLQYNTCFTCGVSWYQDHLSLDCSECGGYAMRRPCISCDGRCKSVWTRNLAATHELRRAQWEGQCTLETTKTTTSSDETIVEDTL